MMNYILLISFFFCFSVTAQDTDRFWFQIDQEAIDREEKAMYLDESQLASERDETSGIDLKTYDTNQDMNKIGFGYQTNSDIRDAADISTFEFHYAKRMEWYWLEFHFARTTATNREIFGFNTNIDAESDLLYQETSSINEFGIGLGTKTKYSQMFFDSRIMFETLSATLNYVSLSEAFYGDDYTGFGVKADYGISWRFASSYHLAIKGSYHLASVKKERVNDDERSFQRSLLIDWFALGIDMTFYY